MTQTREPDLEGRRGLGYLGRTPEEEAPTLAQFMALILFRWPWTLVAPILVGVVTALVILLGSRSYTTTVQFVPVGVQASAGDLVSLAQRFGISFPGQGFASSPEFYADLVRTPGFLRELATRTYQVRDGSGTVRASLIELYDFSGGTADRRLHNAIVWLRTEGTRVSFNRQTSMVTIDVRTKWKDLSQQVASAVVELIDRFNIESRQRQAAAERMFVAQRLDTAAAELRQSEGKLQAFMERNREFRSDPRLFFEYERLQRDIGLRQTVFGALVQAVEQARVESARNTPSIALVQPPRAALRPDRRYVPHKMIAASAVAAIMVWSVLILHALLRREARRDPIGAAAVRDGFMRMRTTLGIPFRRRSTS